MNNIQKVTNVAAKVLGLLALGLALGFTQTQVQAADIKFEVKVPGYTGRGNGWVLVLPELRSVLGGAIRWDSARGSYITDRVQRGETMRITVSPRSGEAAMPWSQNYGVWCDSTLNYLLLRTITLPYQTTYVVPTNPSLYDLYVDVYTTLTPGFFTKRIPIGTR